MMLLPATDACGVVSVIAVWRLHESPRIDGPEPLRRRPEGANEAVSNPQPKSRRQIRDLRLCRLGMVVGPSERHDKHRQPLWPLSLQVTGLARLAASDPSELIVC